MYNFIVLGLIPGTNIQIGFWAYVIAFAVIAAVLFVVRKHVYRRHIKDLFEGRVPLHASQLHSRG